MLLRYWLFAGIAIVAPAQTLTTLVSLNGNNGGAPTVALVQGTDGNFYGTNSTIFKITPGGTLTTLYSFSGAREVELQGPDNGLVQATDGNFYGTTSLPCMAVFSD